MILSYAQQKPQITNLLGRDPKKHRKDTFAISKTAITPSSKLLISQLLS